MSIAVFPRFESLNLGKVRDKRRLGRRALGREKIEQPTQESRVLTPGQVSDLFTSILTAELRYEQTASNTPKKKTNAYMYLEQRKKEVDIIVGDYAEYVNEKGVSVFDRYGNKGTIPDPITNEPGFYTPHHIFELDDAIKIYEHTQTPNSQALVEALLIRYSGPRWQNLLPHRKAQYDAVLRSLREESDIQA